MKQTFLIFSFLFCLARADAQQTPAPDAGKPLEKLQHTTDLAAYNGTAQMLLVTDENAGGLFYYTNEKHTVDNGVVFPAANKGYWIRIYDKTEGVDIAWFGAKMDSATDDGPALSKALAYPLVKITGNIAINSKLTIPEGKTIEFTEKGAVTITDTLAMKWNGYIKAGDYQYIFRGTGKVILGSKAAPYVSACWFGALSDCGGFKRGIGTDNKEPIQRSIFGAQKISDLYLPPSAGNTSYRISSTITIQKKLHFFSFHLHGGGTTITYNADDRASIIFADFGDGAAIDVEGSRRVYLTDFSLHGINKQPHRINTYDTIYTAKETNDPATFLTEGVKMTYAGITTDGDKDSKVWSADIEFERLQIDNFSIGIGISQAGHLQGDRMRVENTEINECVYGISVGQAQNRACHFYNVDMNRVWCGITNNTFGDHTGSEFEVTGGQWCHVYKCFGMQPSYTGQCVVSGLYTEAIGMIGTFGDHNPNNSSFLFTGCEFFMMDDGVNGQNGHFASPFYTLWAYGNITFEGCNFWAAKHYIAMFAGAQNGNYTGSAITMNGCSIHKCNFIHIKGNSMIENTFLIPFSSSINYNRNITIDFDNKSRYNTGYTTTSAIAGMERETANDNKTNIYGQIKRELPRFYIVQDGKNNISNILISHDTMQFSFNDQLAKSFFRYTMAGDIIATSLKDDPVCSYDNPTLQLIKIDMDSKTATALTFAPDISFDKIALYTNCFFTTVPITGTVKKGANIITDVSHYDLLYPGDYITFKESEHAYRVSAINKTDSSLTLMDAITEPVNGKVTLYNEVLENIDALEKTNKNAIRTVSETTILTDEDGTILINNIPSDITITLPSSAQPGHIYNIKKLTGSHIAIIAAEKGSIDGQQSYTLKDTYQGIQVQFDGKNYIILSK